jgi:spore coat protein U-like protein
MRCIVGIGFYCLAVLILAAFANDVAASTSPAKASLLVTANVASTCTIRMARALSPVESSNPLNGGNPVDVQCVTGVTSQVTIGPGNDGQTLIATIAF